MFAVQKKFDGFSVINQTEKQHDCRHFAAKSYMLLKAPI